MTEYGDLGCALDEAALILIPPPRLSLSEWADRNFVLSTETAAEPGRWHTLPYQRGIMDAITDPAVEMVSLKKSARVGYTLMVCAGIGYYIEHDPTSQLVAQPTVDDAKNFSKESIAPMLRDVPCLARIAFKDDAPKGPKDASNTLTHKKYPGGVLSMTGANSGTGFRRISRRVIWLDEVDAYPPSAGSEGDPVRLAMKRAEHFWNRKVVCGSTPLVAGASRIDTLYASGDQRRYFVPCPQCGHMAPLVFRGEDGHSMKWPEGDPDGAFFVCQQNGCIIEHRDKRQMVEGGEWRASAPFKGHASFHLWAAYSYSPGATWAHIAREFVAANKESPEALRTFVNTTLGETWQERGDAPDWQRLYERREQYERGTVPDGVILLTAGVDVQRDRLVWEVVGWGDDRQSWSIDADVIMGDTGGDAPWAELDKVLARTWTGTVAHSIAVLAVDSGDQTQRVYDWARRYPMSRVIAVKGSSSAKAIIDTPSPVDINFRGRKQSHGYKVWSVGASIAKAELYGWLRLPMPTKDGEPFPSGYCHFPQHGEEFFKELTGEHLVPVVKRTGFTVHEWCMIPGRANHFLDCRVYARAAASRAGLDRHAAAKRIEQVAPPTPAPPATSPQPREAAPPPPGVTPRRTGSWLGGGRFGRRGPWIRR